MNRKRLFKELNKLCLELDSKYNINCGGCCYVAACIAEQLENFSIPFEIIHYDLYHCHYAIKVSDRYINRDGYTKEEIYEIVDYDSTELFQIYYNSRWNPQYNPEYNNTIYNKIKELFNENNGT